MATRTPPQHWLARIIGREMEIPASAHLDEVWKRVAEDSGFSDTELALKVASHFHLTVADLNQIEQSAFDLIPEKLARQFQVVGLREKPNQITVASSDPANLRVEQIIAFATGRRVIFEVAAPSQLRQIIESMYAPEYVAEKLLSRARTELADAIRFVAGGLEPAVISLEEAEKTPIVRLTNLILHDAIQAGASDIHVEPDLKDGIVRTRVDGVLQNYMQVPRAVLDRVVSRIKIMGRMDIADRLRPQGGRAHVQVGGVDYDLRISTVPTRQSEKAVVRILGPGRVHSLDDLGVPEGELQRLRQLFSNRDGVLVVTGPTGSGKTTTLYAAIQELATGKINIMTVEDPVEYELSGITQIQVAPRQGLTFAAAIRTVLRQDPDIILVGEIRDLETAEIAVQASMTGHLVLTTLHTNDAVGVLDRLTGLGISRINMASALRGVLAQRLLRRLCFDCREKVQKMTQQEEQLARLYGVIPPYRARGCKQCAGTGYRGRIPVVEILVNAFGIEQLIAAGASAQTVRKEAEREGMLSLLSSALIRAKDGETTLEEIQRVLGIGAGQESGCTAIDTTAELNRLLETDQPSIVVLPFADLSPMQDQAYLCRGFTEQLIHALTTFSNLRVIAGNSALKSRTGTTDAREIGKQLGVASVLEGSIQRLGQRLRISVRLITVEGAELMSECYEGNLSEVFAFEEEITGRISERLGATLFGISQVAQVAKATSDSDAYELYLKGRYEWNRRNENGLRRSVEYFKRAIAQDTNYAAAYAGLAFAYVTLAVYGIVLPDDAMTLALEKAEHALSIDGRSVEALTARSCVRALYFWDWNCEDGFQQAIELEPNNPTARHWYAVHYLVPLGRFDEARAQLQQAIQLDPQSLAIQASIGVLLFFQRRYDEAISQFHKMLASDPGFGIGYYFLAQALTECGHFDDALAALGQARKHSGDSPEILSLFGYTLARAGRSAAAKEVLNDLDRLSKERYVSPVLLAQIAVGLGNHETAIDYLLKGFELRATDLVWLSIRPAFDVLRSDPSFDLCFRILPELKPIK